MTTQGHLWPEHPVVPRLFQGHTADVSASSEWRHNRDVPAMSLGRPPDARETSRPRPSGVTTGDVPETSSAGGHRLSDGCGTSPRRPSPADAPGTSPTVQRRHGYRNAKLSDSRAYSLLSLTHRKPSSSVCRCSPTSGLEQPLTISHT